MDWNAAIDRNREALVAILATLIAMAGLDGRTTLPRHLHRAVLRLLRPAEAAARRLVIVAARGLKVTLPPMRPPRPKPGSSILRGRSGTGILLPPGLRVRKPRRMLSLPLLDPLRGPRRRVARPAVWLGVPRISVPGSNMLFPVAPRRPASPGDPVDATRLGMRLEALGRALENLPAQARRFARWRAHLSARKGTPPNAGRVRRIWPLRPGRPPGSLKRPTHEVHEVLTTLHGLAFWTLEGVDTS